MFEVEKYAKQILSQIPDQSLQGESLEALGGLTKLVIFYLLVVYAREKCS